MIGAGTMGAGITIAFLLAGLRVTMVDAKQVSASERCFRQSFSEQSVSLTKANNM